MVHFITMPCSCSVTYFSPLRWLGRDWSQLFITNPWSCSIVHSSRCSGRGMIGLRVVHYKALFLLAPPFSVPYHITVILTTTFLFLSHPSHQAIDKIPDSLTKAIEGNDSMRKKFEEACRFAQVGLYCIEIDFECFMYSSIHLSIYMRFFILNL